MTQPIVTIAALCYNHTEYVVQTLESIYSQTYKNLQVIVVDDCSKDNTVSVVERWLKDRELSWIFIKHSSNMGVTKTLNETLELAQGKYFKAIACDDILLPHFINTMVECFERLPNDYGLIYSDVQTIDEQSQVFGLTPFKERGWDTEEKIPSGKLFDQLAGWCFIPAVGTFMSTRVLKEIRFDESLMFEDWDMWLQIAKKYKIKGIVDALAKYRIHKKSMYQTKSPEFWDHELRVVEKHLGYSSAADQRIKEFIYTKSILLYMNNGARPVHWLWRRFQIRKTPANLFHVFLALLGIDYKKKEEWKKRVSLS